MHVYIYVCVDITIAPHSRVWVNEMGERVVTLPLTCCIFIYLPHQKIKVAQKVVDRRKPLNNEYTTMLYTHTRTHCDDITGWKISA